jgi:cell wall-associated NlpC family hydrolase
MPPPIRRTDTAPIPVSKPPAAPPPSTPAPNAARPKPAAVDMFDSGRMQADTVKDKLDKVEKELAPKYTVKVDGKDVSVEVPTPFRMNGGDKQPSPEDASKKMAKQLQKGGQWPKNGAAAKELDQAITRNAYGRASPKQIELVTNKLIDSGALKPYLDELKAGGATIGPNELKTAIRRMQWDYGVGTDCNGVCRIAYQEINGKPPTPQWGGELIKTDGKGNSLNPNLKRVSVDEAKPGDLIKLDDVTGDVGHNVVITDTKSISAADVAKDKYTGTPAPVGPLKTMTVLSSFGAGGDKDNVDSGLHKETWVYDAGRKQWGTLVGKDVQWSSTAGPYEHKFVGIYRAK